MKIKVEYKLPAVSVSDEIEVGKLVNGELNTRQTKLIEKLIENQLKQQLLDKMKKVYKPKTILKMVN